MFKNERENEILDILNSQGYATVKSLSEKLHISPSSIRRDLKALENRGVIIRSYGGAEIAEQAGGKVVPFSARSMEKAAQKKKIARRAAALVKPGQVIYLDGSSSAFYMSEYLVSLKNITVVTNSIGILYQLAQFDVKTICTGGTVSPENRAVLADHYASNIINNIEADYVFFSAQALNEQGKIYDCYENEVYLRQLMIRNSRKSVFLADESKFSKSSVYFLEYLKNIDYVVTDFSPGREFLEKYPGTSFLDATSVRISSSVNNYKIRAADGITGELHRPVR